MAIFICPNCGNRTESSERTAGFQSRAKGCKRCGFGFVFELLDDYYPAPNAAFFLLDQQGRLISTGRGARELTGLGDLDVIGRPVQDVLNLEFDSGDDHVATALEWGGPAPSRPRLTSSPRTTTTAACCSCSPRDDKPDQEPFDPRDRAAPACR